MMEEAGVADPVRLRALLGGEAWRWWRMRARAGVEQGRGIPAVAVRAEPSVEERLAANRLFAAPGARGPIRVRRDELLRLLAEGGIAADLVACLTLLDGPISDRSGARERRERAWAELRALAAERLDGLASPTAIAAIGDALRRWCGEDAAAAAALVAAARAVLLLMPTRTGWHLAQLAALATGDAHALDRDGAARSPGPAPARANAGRGRARLARGVAWSGGAGRCGQRLDPGARPRRRAGFAARAAARRRARPAAAPHRPAARRARRDLGAGWHGVGVREPDRARRRRRRARRTLPAADLRRRAADMPSLLLLAQVSAAGADLRYQGDLDWPGLAIAGDLRRQARLRPWRSTAADLAAHAHCAGPGLVGAPVPTPWEPALAAALAERGRGLHEESLLDLLLDDLAAASADGAMAGHPAPSVHAFPRRKPAP